MKEEASVRRYESVRKLCGEGKSRNVAIEPEEPGFAWRECHHLKGSFGAVNPQAIGVNEPDRSLELFWRNFGILRTNVLRCRVLNAITRQVPPVINPDFAEPAAPVVDENRLT